MQLAFLALGTTADGLEGACRGLAAMGVAPRQVWCASQNEAFLAADGVAGRFPDAGVREVEGLLEGAHPAGFFAALASADRDALVCVGPPHRLDVLLSQAIRAGQPSLEPFEPGGAALVEFGSVGAGSGELRWQLAPAALQALGDAT